jgi:hypothetical protein
LGRATRSDKPTLSCFDSERRQRAERRRATRLGEQRLDPAIRSVTQTSGFNCVEAPPSRPRVAAAPVQKRAARQVWSPRLARATGSRASYHVAAMTTAYEEHVLSTWDAAVAAEQGQFLAERARVVADANRRGMIGSGARWVDDVKLAADHMERTILACFAVFTTLAPSLDSTARPELWNAVKRGLSSRMQQHLNSYGGALERQATAEGLGGGSMSLAMSQTLGQRSSNLLKLIDDLVRRQVSEDLIREMGTQPAAARATYVAGDYFERVERMGDTNNVINNSQVAGVTQGSEGARHSGDNRVEVRTPANEPTKKGWGNRAVVIGAIVAAIIGGLATLLSTERGQQLLHISQPNAASAPDHVRTK